MQFTLLLITIQLQPRYFVSPPCFLYSLRSPKTGGACYSSCIFWKWPVPSPTAEATNTGQWVIYFQGHASLQPHWLYKKNNHLHLVSWGRREQGEEEGVGGWGSGSTGNGVGEESILYAPSLNQHTTTRSAPLETAAPWPIQHHLWWWYPSPAAAHGTQELCHGRVTAQSSGKNNNNNYKKKKKHCDFLTCSCWMSNIR